MDLLSFLTGFVCGTTLVMAIVFWHEWQRGKVETMDE